MINMYLLIKYIFMDSYFEGNGTQGLVERWEFWCGWVVIKDGNGGGLAGFSSMAGRTLGLGMDRTVLRPVHGGLNLHAGHHHHRSNCCSFLLMRGHHLKEIQRFRSIICIYRVITVWLSIKKSKVEEMITWERDEDFSSKKNRERDEETCIKWEGKHEKQTMVRVIRTS